ncbi:hypothetical protein VB773_16675 [Haloarculaceae archaeon H-GB2-1]|nr:hypothetical protein [Haloarculaceae archaeon H-GB1-1]MEA5387559.1 hypothetical protein [Haloarculaceae archaeon H-GB11]MEA5409042.1 hypothetical protein [Haloarculaceae archaeon H-GB2-1]
MDLPELEQPAWQTAIGTVLSYGIILVAMFLALFILPYVVFTML